MSSPLAEVREMRANLLWRMLATLGAPAGAEPIVKTAVDPECALVLGSMHGKHDARAAELTLWLGAAARRSLSVIRAKRIAAEVGAEAQADLGQFAATAMATNLGELRLWAKRLGSDSHDPWPIDYSPGRLGDRIGGAQSIESVVAQPGAFRLRMRMAIGAGARAEALAMLMVEARSWEGRGPAWLTLPQIEAGTAFGKRFLLDCLPDMAAAGLIMHEREGRLHAFAADPALIKGVASIPTVWDVWPRRLSLLASIESALRELKHERTITNVMAQARLLATTAPLVVPFDPHADPDLLPQEFEDWCLRATKLLVDIK